MLIFGYIAYVPEGRKAGSSMLVQCCECGLVRRGKTWKPANKAELERKDISHGYCPRCAAKAFAEIRRAHRNLDFPPDTVLSA